MRHYWVDRIEVEEPGVRAVGWKAVGWSEDFFTDHFPGNPVFPGIYMIEGIAQAAGAVIARASDWREFALMVSVDRARFSSFVRPGETVRYDIVVEERTGELARVRGTATVDGRRVAQLRISFRVLELGEMVPVVYEASWTHTLSLLFEAGGGPPGPGSSAAEAPDG